MARNFLLYFMSVFTLDTVEIVYKEGTDRTLLGPIQVTAIYWFGFITQLWYSFLFEYDTPF
jgi:hypothetical protein